MSNSSPQNNTSPQNKSKYGDLQSKMKNKLLKGAIFDSADYFLRLSKLKEKMGVDKERPISIFEFIRKKEDGTLTNPSKLIYDNSYLQEKYIKPKGAVFDSADWSLALSGIIKTHPTQKPHPIMMYFSNDKTLLIPHPEAVNDIDENQIYEITKNVDDKLKKKYGNLDTKDVVKLRLNKKKQNSKFENKEDFYLELNSKNKINPQPKEDENTKN
eukprot:TRINITY_DN9876_c0_g1_i1.p1 TRINITY_DN9876_c0_g1~~TRINITY_DN9876_c0_g1_i1.p1  ORF type:complete len:214 (-),score=90.74 TRINITY_DN9876_c0_g1_i1:102-743(-)